MKKRTIKEMLRWKEQVERGRATPASVWELKPDGKGGFERRGLDPTAFRRQQKTEWKRSIMATRQKLGLSQPKWAATIKTFQ